MKTYTNHSRPIWLDPDQSTFQTLTEDITAQVAIIGAGITGVSLARWLTHFGLSNIVTIDERTVSSGASGRNAGFVMAVAPENFPADGSQTGLAVAKRIWEFTAKNQRLIEETVAEFGLEVEYRKLGSLGLAASQDEWNWIGVSSALAFEAGLDVEIIERARLGSPYLRQNYFGGAMYSANSEINPGLYVRGLARALSDRGVHFFEHTKAIEVTRSREISTASGTIRAEHIVIATNGYTGRLLKTYRNIIKPTRGQVLATQPLGRIVAPYPVYADNGYQYWRQTPDTRLILGGWRNLDFESEVGFAEELNSTIQEELTRVAFGLCEEEVSIDSRWSGIMGFTPDKRPLVGAVPGRSGTYIAAGFSGHGLAMATMAAKELAALITGRNVSYLDLLAVNRFSTDG